MNEFLDNDSWVDRSSVSGTAGADDRHDALQRVYGDELAGDQRRLLIKLSAEMPLLDRRSSPWMPADRPRQRQVGAASGRTDALIPEASPQHRELPGLQLRSRYD
jgi:hypothetical protein